METNWLYEWQKSFHGFLIKRKNGNGEVLNEVIEASRFFAKIKTREGNIFWVHSVNGFLYEVDHDDQMSQIQQKFKEESR